MADFCIIPEEQGVSSVDDSFVISRDNPVTIGLSADVPLLSLSVLHPVLIDAVEATPLVAQPFSVRFPALPTNGKLRRIVLKLLYERRTLSEDRARMLVPM